MPNEHSPDDAIEIWQSQHVEPVTMSVEEIRTKAQKFEGQIRLRNRRETIVAVILIPLFALFLRWFPAPLERAGSLLIIAGILFILYRLNGKAAAAPLPAETGLQTCLAFHRRELERQRDLLRTIAYWYLGPLMPGIILFTAAVIGQSVRPGHPLDWWRALPSVLIAAAWFWFTIRLNRRAADTLQRAIDDLSRQ